jgi:hypothetical protein
MNWKHYLLIGLTGLSAAATAVANASPELAGYCHAITAFCTAGQMVFGLMSSQVLGKKDEEVVK